jgi:hypothetical protein
MSSTRFVPPLDISLSASFHYYLLILGCHLPVFLTGLLYLYDMPVLGVAVEILVMISLYISLVLRPKLTNLAWRQQAGWRIMFGGDDINGLTLLPASRYSGMFCALYFQTSTGRRIDVIVFPDSTGMQPYKKLLVLLRSGVGISGSAKIP